MAFAFDLDGTVIDSRVDIVDCVNYTLEYYKLDKLPFDKIVSYVGNGAKVLMERVLGENLKSIDLDEAVKKFREIYIEHCVDNSYIFDGIRECFNDIKSNNHYLFMITNKPSPHSLKIMSHFNLLNKLNEIYSQDTMKALKPDPVTIKDLLTKYTIESQRFFMIGDSRVDMEFAKSGGVKSIMVGYGGVVSHSEFISTPSDYKVKTSAELRDLINNIIQSTDIINTGDSHA